MTEALETQTNAEWWNRAAWTDQRSPALAIVARGDQIRPVSPNQYTVASQSHPGTFHHITQTGAKWGCDCPFFAATSKVCIHILAVRFREGYQEPVAPPATVPACDKCRSTEVIAFGKRHNKSGTVPTYLCQACGRRFAGREGYKNRRTDPDKIALALDLYFRGLSIRKVQDHFKQVQDLKISHSTIYRWIAHYSLVAARWMDQQQARTSDRWHVDETVVDVNGKNTYLWNILDHETRFLLATHISKNRSLANTRAPFKKAKLATPDRPADVLSDGMNTYPEAISKELGRTATPFDDPKLIHGHSWFSPHRRVPSIRAKESNNRIERFHGTEKERFKVMRAFDNDPGASTLSEGLRVHYNLVRPHQALRGQTPGEAAGIPTTDGFRWRQILREATESAEVTTRKETAEGNG